MADFKILEERLKEIGCNFRFWGRAELKELANVLLPGEIVEHCVNGQYEGGFALLCATNHRVLLIDKKPMYLTLEDIRFDMISEIDYNHRMMDSNVFICTPNKNLRFTAFNQVRLRKLFHFVQTRVMEIRQHFQQQSDIWKQYATNLQAQQEGLVRQAQALTGQQQSVSSDPQQPNMSVPQLQMPEQPMSFPGAMPIISAYTRLPIMSRQRRFLGSRAMNSSFPSSLQ